MLSQDAKDFFQSDEQIALQEKREAKKSTIGSVAGHPKEMSSKVLSFQFVNPLDINDHRAYVAESGFLAKKIDLKTGKTLASFRGHTGPATCTAIMYDSNIVDKLLFTGSWDKTIKKWDVKTMTCIDTFKGHSDFIKGLVIFKNNLFSCSTDSTIRKWDINTGKELLVLKDHSRSVEDIVIDDDGAYLYSASSDTTIKKWDVESGSLVATFQGHLTSVYKLLIAEGSLYSASADKTAKRWDLETGICDSTYTHPDYVKSVAVSGSMLITGCRDENIRIWDITSEKLLYTIEGHFGEVSDLQVRGSSLFSGSLDCTIRMWSLVETDLKAAVQNQTKKPPRPSSLAKTKSQSLPGITEEEDAELAELMDD